MSLPDEPTGKPSRKSLAKALLSGVASLLRLSPPPAHKGRRRRSAGLTGDVRAIEGDMKRATQRLPCTDEGPEVEAVEARLAEESLRDAETEDTLEFLEEETARRGL